MAVTHRQFKRLAVVLTCSAITAAGVSACGGETRVVISTGKNAGKTYGAGLVGGLTAEECVRQGLCTEVEE